MKKILVTFLLGIMFSTGLAQNVLAAPVAPTMTLSAQGLVADVSWSSVPGATGYKLYYAPYPFQGEATIGSFDMGTNTNFSAMLWPGAAFFVAIQAYDQQESSDYSNIDFFVMGPPTPEWVDDDGDGYSEYEGDCNDSDASVRPMAQEICGDGIDQDCLQGDRECGPDDIDNDGDGFSENQGDCNDLNQYFYPGAIEYCEDGYDTDCNGTDLSCYNVDVDGDGYSAAQGDCNDNSGAIRPGAPEICGDGIDQDCSGSDLQCPPLLNDYFLSVFYSSSSKPIDIFGNNISLGMSGYFHYGTTMPHIYIFADGTWRCPSFRDYALYFGNPGLIDEVTMDIIGTWTLSKGIYKLYGSGYATHKRQQWTTDISYFTVNDFYCEIYTSASGANRVKYSASKIGSFDTGNNEEMEIIFRSN